MVGQREAAPFSHVQPRNCPLKEPKLEVHPVYEVFRGTHCQLKQATKQQQTVTRASTSCFKNNLGCITLTLFSVPWKRRNIHHNHLVAWIARPKLPKYPVFFCGHAFGFAGLLIALGEHLIPVEACPKTQANDCGSKTCKMAPW